ncbi:MAG: hypothetical protein WC675_03310 [Patescibacteria group bacterium]|jgi:hypothetical protein
MPIKQLHIVEKIKFIVSSSIRTKKQILDEVEEDAQEHHLLNQMQEKEDDAKVDHAQKELQEENEIADGTYSRIFQALVISIFINFIFLVAFAILWYFLIYR